MLPHLKCLLCLSIITVARCLGIDTRYSDLKIIENNRTYQIPKGNEDKVELKVYYESHSPACIDFFTNEFIEVYQKLGSNIDLIEYPFGRAFHRFDYDFYCEHGPAECYGNKLHACSIDILKNASQSHAYITCMMQSHWGGDGSTDMDAIKCGELMKIDSKAVIECAKGEKGDILLDYLGYETRNARIGFVPWIVLNGKLIDYFNDLLPQICDVLTNPPPACKHNAEHIMKSSI